MRSAHIESSSARANAHLFRLHRDELGGSRARRSVGTTAPCARAHRATSRRRRAMSRARAAREVALGATRAAGWRARGVSGVSRGKGGVDVGDGDALVVQRVIRRINRRVAIAVSAFDGTVPVPSTTVSSSSSLRSASALASSMKTTPSSLFVWLHGFADDGGASWAEFAHAVVDGDARERTLILTPDAPLVRAPRAFEAHKGVKDDLEVRAWFEPRLRSAPGRAAESWTCDGMEASIARVRAIVDETCAEHAIPLARVVLGGFSQGACLALACAARDLRDVGGVLAVRGYLPNRVDRVDDGANEARPHALILAGGADPLVPVDWSLEAGQYMRARVVLNEDVGHELSADDIYCARRWLSQRFAA
jgi:predicted esterase